jgi:hypothetical protein
VTEQKAHGTADRGQRDALGEQLTHEARPSRAHGHAHGHLLGPPLGSREQEVGDVRAGDEEHEENGRHEEEHLDPDIGQHVVGEGRRLQRMELGVEAVCRSIFLAGPRDDPIEIGLGALERRPLAQSRHEVEEVTAAGVDVVRGIHAQGTPHVDVGVLDVEAGRQDADDRGRPAVEADGGSEDRRVGAERPPPQTVGDHRDRSRARQVLLLAERPTRGGFHSHGREERPGSHRRRHPQRPVGRLDRHGAGAVGTDLGERLIPVP